jgi:ferric-dicitrate binding protein FerR (iron transport regulator)
MAYDKNIYSRIIIGEVTKEEIEQLKSTGEWDEIQKILKVTEGFSLPELQLEEGYKKLSERKNKIVKTRAKTLNLKRVMSIAALFIVILGAGWFFEFSTITHIAPNGEFSSVLLPDESVIKLNDGSSIEYARSFSRKRVVKLMGEGFFDVQKGSSFVVKTVQGEVRVLGTRFNVNTWSEKLNVECYEGKVEVISGEDRIILNAGEMIDLNLDSESASQNITHIAPFWMNGESRFYNRPLLEVMNEIERQFDVEITSELGHREFSGKFNHTNLEEALQQVCKPLGLNYSIDQGSKVTITN